MSQIRSFRDLKVYQKLRGLHLEVSQLTLRFPKFELYELGAQVRRSSNAVPSILAEGWESRPWFERNRRHTKPTDMTTGKPRSISPDAS